MNSKNITLSQGDVANIKEVVRLGIQLEQAIRLIEISRKLHAIAERECNGTVTNRDGNTIPKLLNEARLIWDTHKGSTTRLDRVCDPRAGRGLTWGYYGSTYYI